MALYAPYRVVEYAAKPSWDKHAESELIHAAQTGDREAFGHLYEGLIGRIYRYIYFRVGDEPTAQDLTSDVFLKAWEHLPGYKAGTSSFVSWLYRIAHNTVIDHYRAHRQTAPLDEMISLAEDKPEPDEQVQQHAEYEFLQRALGTLTDMQRDVITLKLISEMDTEEVAQHLGKRPGAVRALQMRALRALADAMQEGAGA